MTSLKSTKKFEILPKLHQNSITALKIKNTKKFSNLAPITLTKFTITKLELFKLFISNKSSVKIE